MEATPRSRFPAVALQARVADEAISWPQIQREELEDALFHPGGRPTHLQGKRDRRCEGRDPSHGFCGFIAFPRGNWPIFLLSSAQWHHRAGHVWLDSGRDERLGGNPLPRKFHGERRRLLTERRAQATGRHGDYQATRSRPSELRQGESVVASRSPSSGCQDAGNDRGRSSGSQCRGHGNACCTASDPRADQGRRWNASSCQRPQNGRCYGSGVLHVITSILRRPKGPRRCPAWGCGGGLSPLRRCSSNSKGPRWCWWWWQCRWVYAASCCRRSRAAPWWTCCGRSIGLAPAGIFGAARQPRAEAGGRRGTRRRGHDKAGIRWRRGDVRSRAGCTGEGAGTRTGGFWGGRGA
mmetsp:Transcript_6978/g.20167  ORF Transcript_6978/g.20167 Transcript_6978/m.20167 type:complete len:352 (+) Transcript_6978:211-1266(+)